MADWNSCSAELVGPNPSFSLNSLSPTLRPPSLSSLAVSAPSLPLSLWNEARQEWQASQIALLSDFLGPSNSVLGIHVVAGCGSILSEVQVTQEAEAGGLFDPGVRG